MRAARRVWLVLLLVLVGGLIGTSITRAAKPPPPPPSCTLVPQLRDVTVNQGIGAYSPLVNGKETLVRFYLSMPSCAGSGAMIQIKEGTTLTVSGGGSPATVELTPVPLSTAYPAIASFSAAPMTDSTGDPKFIVPASTVTSATAFTAGFSALIRFQSQPTRTSPFTSGQVTFSTRPGTTTPIQASFDKPSNALGVLFVPMGDATKTYSTQWTTNGQQALQDGMTAAVARQYPLPAGVGNLGGTGGLRYTVAPTLLDLTRVGPTGLNLLIPPQTPVATKFCGTGANYDLIKAELGQFLLAHNTVNTNAKANRVVGVVDPAVGLGPPDPCFEGMAVVNSQEAWALARPGRAGQLIGLELAHTLGLTPPPRESPFDGAHSQNIPAENPSANRRYNLVQRSFITTDRSLMKPSGTNPSPDNINTLLEVPDFAFLLCVFGGTLIPECQNYGPGTVSATAPVAASLSFVMSGTTTGEAGIPPASTGTATGTSVFESYFASSIGQTTPSTNSLYRLVQRASAGGTVLSNQGVPVTFLHSEHGTGSASSTHSSGLFSLALPFLTTTNRVELWKGAPDASGSLLLYATDRTQAPVLSSFSVGGGGIGYRLPARASAPTVTQAVETLQAEADTPTTPTTITSGEPLSTSVTFGSLFSSISDLCVTWHFTGDLFDEGETVTVTWGGGGGGGAGNGVGTGGSRRLQTLCMGSQATRDLLLDGTESFSLGVEGGSVTVGAVVISVTGDSTPPVGYRIATDAFLYTVQAGSSVDVTTTLTDDVGPTPDTGLTARNLVPSGGFSTTPSSGFPTYSSTGTLSTSASTPPGDYALIVTGRGGGFNRTAETTIRVTAAPPSGDLVVNDAGDEADGYPDGVCDSDLGTDGNQCTLRAAIEVSNAEEGADTITFAIPTSDFPSIAVGTGGLPTITDPVTIDATTQDPESTTPDVELDGSDAGVSAHGLNVTAGSTTIKGFVIDDFGADGIHLESGGDNIVVGNWVGTDQSGQESSPNSGDGIQMEGSDGNQIGGPTAAERNVVSSSVGHGIFMYESDGNAVEGNYVGTDVDGLEDFGNGIDGIAADGGSNNDIGGNVTSGNTNQGVALFSVGSSLPSNGNTVEDNTVGLDVEGAPLPNGGVGVLVEDGTGNRIRQNSIAWNGGLGIDLAETDVPSRVTENDESDADTGSNNLQNFPLLESVSPTQVSGTLDTNSNIDASTYVLDFFESTNADEGDPGCDGSGNGEGQLYVGSTNVEIGSSGSNDFTFTFELEVALGSYITATATDPSGNTSEFSECILVEESLPGGRESWDAAATDDFPQSLTLDGFLDCGPGKPVWSIFNAKKPDSTSATTAFWSGTFDPSLAPAGCTLKVKPNDGFTQPGFTLLGEETVNDGPNSLVAAISSPPHVTPVATFLQYSLIPLRGLVMNPDGVLPGSAYDWTLTGPGINRTGLPNTFRDEQPPSGGWPTPGGAATYTATLSSQVGTTSATDTVTFTIKADADNDGIARDVESLPCFGSPPAGVAHNDNNPLNADDDSDGDGIPNASDPQPCTPASSYTALIEFNPDPFPTPSNGNTVTVYVRVPGRNVGQVLSNTVRISRIADQDIAPADFFKNIAWSVSGGVGTAKFDRQKLIAWLAARNIDDQTITVTVVGNAGAPAWSFEGSDTVFITD